MTFGSLRDKQRRLTRAENRADRLRAERDAEIVDLARKGHRYRDLADAIGLSLAAIGKIASAGGIRRYQSPQERATTTKTHRRKRSWHNDDGRH